jgi:hypothetical protein
MPRSSPLAVLLGLVVIASSCTGEAAECVSNGVGEVCAEANEGAITFRGDGLLSGSTVELGDTAVGPITYVVGDDGSFDPGSASGVMAVFSGTEFSFEVTATDADGAPLSGRIVVASP